ncbi:MAG: EutN/CcmL family microcompartment protein [Caldicoprobacterales bacterium]|nr:EutN/CcmL family microcompartment protein [Clostridiales bacterium]
MLTGKVVGSVVSTVKDSALRGIKLLMVSLDNTDEVVIAADLIKVAGVGDHVYLVTGREAAIGMGEGLIPIDMGITGVIDTYNNE